MLYTDGVVESLNLHRKMFGFDRLHATLARVSAIDPQALIEEILNAIRLFQGPVEQVDDVTLLAIQMGGLNQ